MHVVRGSRQYIGIIIIIVVMVIVVTFSICTISILIVNILIFIIVVTFVTIIRRHEGSKASYNSVQWAY